MKKIGINNIGAVVIIVLMLLISVSSAITVKFGTDSDGDAYYGLQGEFIYNSNGQAWEPTEDNLRIAIYDLNNTGGVVYLPNATITVTKSINISHDNISLIGRGRTSVLYTTSDINILEMWGTAAYPNDLRGCYVEKIYFKGTAAHTSKAGITLGRAHHDMIQECWFSNLYDGMNIGNTDDTDNNWFSNCHFSSITHYAITLNSQCQENTVIGMTMEPGTQCDVGIRCVGVNNAIIGNCVEEVGLTSGTGDGIYVGGAENVCTGNTVRECGRYGIYINVNTGIWGNQTVTSNFISDCESYGMYVRGEGHVISNNVIKDNVGYGIYVGGAMGKGCIISDNQIGGHSSGFYIDTTDNATFMGNMLDKNYEFLVTPENVSINFTGNFWMYENEEQVLEISRSGAWSYIRGGQESSDNFRIQPGLSEPYIDMEGSGNFKIVGSDGAGDYIYMYEDTNWFLRFDLNGNDAEINANTYNITIDDVLKIEPRTGAPTSPVEGMIYYEATNNSLLCYTGAGWDSLLD